MWWPTTLGNCLLILDEVCKHYYIQILAKQTQNYSMVLVLQEFWVNVMLYCSCWVQRVIIHNSTSLELACLLQENEKLLWPDCHSAPLTLPRRTGRRSTAAAVIVSQGKEPGWNANLKSSSKAMATGPEFSSLSVDRSNRNGSKPKASHLKIQVCRTSYTFL